MVTRRNGKSSLGCLMLLLLVAVVGYFGVNIGEAYFRFYQFQDAMRQEVRFAARNSDAAILRHLRAQVDSLGLPEAAADVMVQRNERQIEIEADYYEHIELPLGNRELHFNPRAEGSF